MKKDNENKAGMNPGDPQFSEEQLAMISEAKLVMDFVETSLKSRLSDPGELKKFYQSPTAYLQEMNTPMVDRFSDEQGAAYDAFAREVLDDDTLNLGCKFCRLGVGIPVFAILIVGSVVIAATISVLAAALVPFLGIIAKAFLVIASVGINVGVRITARLSTRLIWKVCREMKAC